MTKTLHFPPASGLESRPFDVHDHLCQRYWRSRKNYFQHKTIEKELIRRGWTRDNLNCAWTHGRNIELYYRVEVTQPKQLEKA